MSEEPKTTLTDGAPVTPDHREINPATGMQKGYVVLSEEERAKGFVRPVRRSYRHVGKRPQHPVRELTPEEAERYAAAEGFVKFEEYPPGFKGSATGRFWTQAELSSGCGTVTTMGLALAGFAHQFPSHPELLGREGNHWAADLSLPIRATPMSSVAIPCHALAWAR